MTIQYLQNNIENCDCAKILKKPKSIYTAMSNPLRIASRQCSDGWIICYDTEDGKIYVMKWVGHEASKNIHRSFCFYVLTNKWQQYIIFNVLVLFFCLAETKRYVFHLHYIEYHQKCLNMRLTYVMTNIMARGHFSLPAVQLQLLIKLTFTLNYM